jgi:hypothetical protein
MPSDQHQSNATGNGGLCRIDPDGEIRVNQGQRFQNENPISRSQADASTLLFFICQCVELSLSNYFCRLSGSLQLFISQKRCSSVVVDPFYTLCSHELNFHHRGSQLC